MYTNGPNLLSQILLNDKLSYSLLDDPGWDEVIKLFSLQLKIYHWLIQTHFGL